MTPQSGQETGSPIGPRELEDYFRHRLAAEVDTATVIGYVKNGELDRRIVVDVRDRDVFAQGHLEGAVNIPYKDLHERLGDLPKDQEILVYCYDHECMLSTQAAFMLAKNGFRVRDVVGGWKTFHAHDAPTETGKGETLQAAAA